MSDEKKASLLSLRAAAPVLNAGVVKELDALDELLTAYGAASVVELKTTLFKQLKIWRKSPDGFAARIADFRAGTKPEFGEPDSVETLVAEFAKATGPTVKSVAKKFGLELVDKNDADDFERWLRTGVEPPTVEEKLRAELAPEIEEALRLRDQTRRELTAETIDRILAVAERVATARKFPGLAALMRGIDVVPTAKTAKAALKELRRFLEDFAVNRLKATQIREMNDY